MTNNILKGGKRGTGLYAPFKALWHLHEIGVLEDLETYKSPAWKAVEDRLKTDPKRSRVALIDTSVATNHPNLEGVIAKDLSIDFFSVRYGALHEGKSGSAASKHPRLQEACDGGKFTFPKDRLPKGAKQLWTDLTTQLKSALGSKTDAADFGSPVRPATSPSFSAHGTAMAGLIGARPRSVAESKIADLLPDDDSTPKLAFAYAGVDPYCEIVPISTNFDPEPEQLILAILYAVLIESDVIVLARDFPTPKSLLIDGKKRAEEAAKPAKDKAAKEAAVREMFSDALGVGLRPEEMRDWAVLEELLLQVSKSIPIVCAAGNGGDDNVLYPASIAAPDNGIISVGALTAARLPASYTPTSKDITVYAPSGDGERLDQGMKRVDTLSVSYREDDHSGSYVKDFNTKMDRCEKGAPLPPFSTFSSLDLVSTDVPGRAGYNSSPFAPTFGEGEEILDYRSCYCRFSGTSGAVGVVAGLISLAVSVGKVTSGKDGSGKAIKDAMTKGQASDYKTATPALDWARFDAL